MAKVFCIDGQVVGMDDHVAERARLRRLADDLTAMHRIMRGRGITHLSSGTSDLLLSEYPGEVLQDATADWVKQALT